MNYACIASSWHLKTAAITFAKQVIATFLPLNGSKFKIKQVELPKVSVQKSEVDLK